MWLAQNKSSLKHSVTFDDSFHLEASVLNMPLGSKNLSVQSTVYG